MTIEVIEPDGTRWTPRTGAHSTAEEFTAARATMRKIRRQARWNPWLCDDRAEELASAETVFSQWRRAEPGFRQLTWPEVEARMVAEDRRFEVESRRRTAQREARRAAFDPQRSAARLKLLEYQARLQRALDERPTPTLSRSTPTAGRRANSAPEIDEIADFEQKIAALHAELGDPDTVVDKHGRLPAERRDIALMEFRRWREEQVRGLRRSVSELHIRLADTNVAKTERSTLRDQVKQHQRRLQVLEDLPPMGADEMCSECPRPLQWHSFTASPVLLAEVGPCPAWPRWAERIRGIREQMEQWATLRRESTPPPAPATPKPAPLAVIPSQTPVSDVIERLSRIQAQHPDAQVRRGPRNSWEIWAPPESPHEA
ncbi:hypothetical protein [Rhodococcus rhodochrous]|uniref:hypothetical protein n=1 Tax=Rhodococcus rhodochrous TaxID=1829 RepID=UPI000374D02A|nr:hypothetical protein [Rhodococcus rhodochrous]